MDTGEFLLGTVSVTPVFFNSTGQTDPSTQDWSSETNEQGLDEIDQVMQELTSGLDWWVDTLDTLNTVHSLEFDVDSTFVDTPFDTRFEPIDRNGADFIQYVTEFVAAQGYSGVSSIEDGVRQFNQQQRIDHGTDWAITIFVVDASDDQDQQFAPGSGHRGAFAFAGGLFMVVPSTRTADVFAHELGHIFWAMDEYQFGASWQDARGYYNGQLLNAADNPAFDQPGVDQEISIMRGFSPQAQAFEQHVSPESTLALVGWQDSDGDGIFDVLDVPLDLDASGYFDIETSEYHFVGVASAIPLINRNSSGPQSDITLNRVSQIQYRLDDGDWIDAATPEQQVAEIDVTISINDPFESIQWRARDSSTGVTSPIIAGTALIPALGSTSISGLAFVDSNANGQRDGSELSLENTTVVIRNADGSPLFQGKVDAAEQQDGFLPAPIPGVTITVAGENLNTNAGSFLSAEAGNRRVFYSYDPFEDQWSDAWSADTELKAAFDQSVGQVSFEVVGLGGGGFGRLDAYDAEDNLVTRATTNSLAEGDLETITVSDPDSRIASVRVYGHADSVVALSKLTFGVSDTYVTDKSGAWSFRYLADGPYMVELTPERVIHEFENSTINIEVSGGASELIMADADNVDSIRHNSELPEDTNGFDGVTSLDALVVINDLGRNSVRILQPHETVGPNVDVNNDGMVSALDALLVINFLGRQNSTNAESEPTALALCRGGSCGLVVVDLVKDPRAAGSLTRSTTPKTRLDEALDAGVVDSIVARARPDASAYGSLNLAQMLKYAGGAAAVESTGTDSADTNDRVDLGDDPNSDSLSPLDSPNGRRKRAPSSFDLPQEDLKNKTLPAFPDDLDGGFDKDFEEPFNGFAV